MDEWYDQRLAEQLLQFHSNRRLQDDVRGLQVPQLFQRSSKEVPYRVQRDGHLYRFIYNESGSEPEEIVASIQGAVYSLDIAPLCTKPPNISQLKYLWQSIGVTALNTGIFTNVYKAIAEVQTIFGQEIGSALDECTVFGNWNGAPTLDMCNRYLTPRRDSEGKDIVPITKDVDPKGYLSAITKGGHYSYTSENVVYYHSTVIPDGEKELRIEECRPTKFQIGDIVEVQLSFVALPIRGDRYKLSLILRGILLLDNKPSTMAAVNRISHKAMRTGKVSLNIKRKAGYGEEGMRITQDKLLKLNLRDITGNNMEDVD